MTGYGRASTKIQIGSCNVEIRSLNSRNLDIKFSGLSLSAELEQKIRSLLSEKIQRGSVKVFIDFDNHDAERFKSFDEDIKHWSDYDYIIINKNLEVCFRQIETIIKTNKTSHFPSYNSAIL